MPPPNPHGPRDTFREHINVPIQIPAWGLLCMLIGAVFTSGTLYQKMDALIDSSRANDQQVSQIRERQIINTAILGTLQEQQRATDARLSALERGAPK
jgi:hypothetical protein